MLKVALRVGVASAILFTGVCGVGATDAPVQPLFVDETASSSIASVYAGDWEYMVGGGAAAFDCNDDGRPDLLLAGGAAKATFYRNISALGGELRFAAEPSGLELDAVAGAYPLDVDSDGHTDLVLLRVGENVVMKGLGGCRFERANEAWAFAGGNQWSTAFAATWEKGSRWPSLAIGNYIDRFEEMSPWGSCDDNWLHRPTASGERFAKPLALKPSYCPLSMLFTDWNRSGTPALRVSNDREYYEGGQEQLWVFEPGSPPRAATQADGWKPLKIWGMGIASYDLDLNGYPEYFLTSMADNKLQTLAEAPESGPARPTYIDVALARGVTAHRPHAGGEIMPSTAWHAQFEDVNNDGRVDLFVAKGNVAEMPDFALNDPNNLLVQTQDGQFLEVSEKAGVASFNIARGGALADFNLDGRVDLVVVNRWKSAEIWRNVTQGAGNWLQLRLEQPDVNRDAIGAWIEVRLGERTLRREITAGGGHAGGHVGWHHFGLGAFAAADVRVLWPDGTAGAWETVPANGFSILKPTGGAVAWTAN